MTGGTENRKIMAARRGNQYAYIITVLSNKLLPLSQISLYSVKLFAVETMIEKHSFR